MLCFQLVGLRRSLLRFLLPFPAPFVFDPKRLAGTIRRILELRRRRQRDG